MPARSRRVPALAQDFDVEALVLLQQNPLVPIVLQPLRRWAKILQIWMQQRGAARKRRGDEEG